MRLPHFLLCLVLVACNGSLQDGLYVGQAKAPPPAPPPATVLEVKYKANSKIPTPVTTRRAVEIGPGDAQRFPDEATVLGYLALRVRVDASEEELSNYLAVSVATRGGTHFLIRNDDTLTHEEVERDHQAERGRAVAQAFSEFGCSGPNPPPRCYRSHYDGPIYRTVTRSERTAYAVVIAVPEEQWANIPGALRPTSERARREAARSVARRLDHSSPQPASSAHPEANEE